MIDFNDTVTAKNFKAAGMRGQVPEDGYFTNADGEPAFAKGGVQVGHFPLDISDIEAAIGSGSLDIVHGGTGASNAASALANLGVPVFSILNYGAINDGDGQGGGTNNQAAFQAAIAVAKAAGGGVLYVPPGIYRKDSFSTIDFSNLEVVIDGFVDITNNPSGYAFGVIGSAGTPFNFITADKTIGDSTIQADADAARIVGAPVKIISTLVCNSTDPPLQWQLGKQVTSRIYFGEWHNVAATPDSTTFVLDQPLQFPGYTRSQTGVGVRVCSTVQVPQFVENVHFRGAGGFISYGATQVADVGPDCVWFQYARNCTIGGLTFNSTLNEGQFVRFLNCTQCRILSVRQVHSANLDISDAFDHNRYNSIKLTDCAACYVEYYEENGAQGCDDSYLNSSSSILNYGNVFVAHTLNNLMQSITSHGNCYDHTYTVYDTGSRQAIFWRGRYSTVTVYGGSAGTSGNGYVHAAGHGCLNAKITGRVVGGAMGVQFERDELAVAAPATWNSSVRGMMFDSVAVGIRTMASYGGPDPNIPVPTTDPSNLTIEGCDFNNCGRAYTGDPYVNRVLFLNNTVNGLSATTGFATVFNADSVEHVILGNGGSDIGATNTFYRQSGISDRTTFPLATYPTNRVTYDGKAPLGSMLGDTSGGGAVASQTITAATYTITTWDLLTGRKLVCNRATAMTITLPQFSDVGVSAFGVCLPVSNIGAGTVTFAAGTGATVESGNGVRLVGAGTQALLTKRAGSSWVVFKGGGNNDLNIWDYGADGLGGATDLAALDAMLAALVAGLPKLPDWARGPVNVGLLIPGPPGTDPMPYLQKIYAAFDTALLWAATFDYTSVRDWVFSTRPSTGLGPQSQYLTPPLKSTHRWMGAVWDASAWRESTTRTISNITAANPCVVTYTGNNPVDGDWIRIGGPPGSSDAVGGMTQINNRGFLVYLLDTGAKTFQLKDPVSKAVISSAAYTPYTSGGTWNVISSPTVFRREGTYGTPLTVSGTLAKWATSIAVTSGGTTIKPGDRFLLCNTTALTTLVGAFTLVDAAGTQSAARSETIIAAGPAVGGVIPIENALRDTYDTSATPLLYPILNEPEIQLVNPAIKGPSLLNDTRMFLFALCRNARIDGGNISQIGGNIAAVYGSLGGHIKDMTLTSTRQPGLSGGGIVYGADTTGFEISGNRSFGNSQVIMASGTGSFYGITRDVTVRENYIYNAATGISTHNLHECLNFIDNEIWFPAVGIDIRCPLCIVRGNLVDGATAQVMLLRISPNGLIVDGLVGRNSLTGIYLEDSNSPEYDYDPANFTLRNLVLENIGGSGSKGAISFSYGQLRSGVRPVLGGLLIENAYVSMNNNTIAISVGGKWTTPKVSAVIEASPGASPSNQSVFFSSAGGIAGQGPSDTFLSVKQSSTYQIPLTQHTTGRVTETTAIEGLTSTRVVTLTTATTLVAPQASSAVNSGEFNNSGAVALVQVTLPSATGASPQMFRFDVTSAQGFKIIAGAGDTIQIGAGAPGAAAGSITSAAAPAAPIGSWVTVRSVTSVKWVASVNDPADWTVA